MASMSPWAGTEGIEDILTALTYQGTAIGRIFTYEIESKKEQAKRDALLTDNPTRTIFEIRATDAPAVREDILGDEIRIDYGFEVEANHLMIRSPADVEFAHGLFRTVQQGLLDPANDELLTGERGVKIGPWQMVPSVDDTRFPGYTCRRAVYQARLLNCPEDY